MNTDFFTGKEQVQSSFENIDCGSKFCYEDINMAG